MPRRNRRKKEHIKGMRTVKIPRRMEIWYADLPLDRRTSVQGGNRPVLIVSNDTCNVVSSTITVIPLTTQIKHPSQPTHVVIEMESGEISMVLAEQIMTIDKRKLNRRIDVCEEPEVVGKIEAAIKEQLSLPVSQTENKVSGV